MSGEGPRSYQNVSTVRAQLTVHVLRHRTYCTLPSNSLDCIAYTTSSWWRWRWLRNRSRSRIHTDTSTDSSGSDGDSGSGSCRSVEEVRDGNIQWFMTDEWSHAHTHRHTNTQSQMQPQADDGNTLGEQDKLRKWALLTALETKCSQRRKITETANLSIRTKVYSG